MKFSIVLGFALLSTSFGAYSFSIHEINSGMTVSELEAHLENELGYVKSDKIGSTAYEFNDWKGNSEGSVLPVEISNIVYDYQGRLYQMTVVYSLMHFIRDSHRDVVSSIGQDSGAVYAFKKVAKENLDAFGFSSNRSMLTFTVRDNDLYKHHVNYMEKSILELMEIN